MENNRAVRVSLSKLLKKVRCDPFINLCLTKNRKWDRVGEQVCFLSEVDRHSSDRAEKYDIPRINYFRRRFLEDKRVDAIELESHYCDELFINNGYHRICGAILAKAKTILVKCEGWDKEAKKMLQEIRA